MTNRIVYVAAIYLPAFLLIPVAPAQVADEEAALTLTAVLPGAKMVDNAEEVRAEGWQSPLRLPKSYRLSAHYKAEKADLWIAIEADDDGKPVSAITILRSSTLPKGDSTSWAKVVGLWAAESASGFTVGSSQVKVPGLSTIDKGQGFSNELVVLGVSGLSAEAPSGKKVHLCAGGGIAIAGTPMWSIVGAARSYSGKNVLALLKEVDALCSALEAKDFK